MSGIFHWNEGIIHEGGVIGKKDASVSGTLTWRLNHLENLSTDANTKLDTFATNQGTQITRLTEIRDFVDTAETKLAQIITDLATYEGNRNTDQDLLNTRVGDITTPATGTLLERLLALKTSIDTVNTTLGTYEGNRNTDADLANTRLTEIRDYLDTVETSLSTMISNATTYEGNRNTDQDAIKTSIDLTNTKIGDPSTSGTMLKVLTDIATSVSAGSANTAGSATAGNQTTEIARLVEIRDYLDTVETTLNTISANLTSYEGNRNTDQDLAVTRLTEIRDYLDTVETKLAQQITDAATYEGNRNTDQDLLNSRIGEVQPSPTANTLLDRVLQLKTSIDTINTNLGTYETNRNSDADLANTRLTEVRDYLDTVETKLQSLIDNQATYESNRNTDQDLTNTKLGDTSTAGTVIKELDQIRTAQTDGTQKSLTGKVTTSATANIVDSTIGYVALDAKQRMRLENIDAMDPWQSFIEKYGSISTASATDVIISNATTIATGYPAQSIDYTVSASKTFYLKKLIITLDIPPTNGNNHISISIGGVKKMHYHIKASNGSSFEIIDFWEKGYPVAAGTTIQVYVRTDTGVATIFWVRLEGYEENN